MDMYIGQKARHKDVYNGREDLEVAGFTKDKVLLKGDFSGGTNKVEQESWLPYKGLILQNIWGVWIDPDNQIDFTKNAGPRDF